MDTLTPISIEPGDRTALDDICDLHWSSLDRDGISAVAWAYYYFSVQFRENLEVAYHLYPGDLLKALVEGECNTDNLSPWPGVVEAGEKVNHDEFMRRLLTLSPIELAAKQRIEAAGVVYLSRTRAEDDVTKASCIASYEDGGLERLFTTMLTCQCWDTPLLAAFQHFLLKHISFDSGPDGGHGALTRHLAPDTRVERLWQELYTLFIVAEPRLVGREGMSMPCNRVSLRSRTLRVTAADRFISDDGTWISLGSLSTGASINPASAHGRSVLIKTTKQLPTVLALLELDGVAQRVVLCPQDQWHHVPSIIETAAINIVASDEQYEWIPMLYATCTLDYPVRHDRDMETEWILLTSGTTGQPKMAIHTLDSLAGPLEDGVAATGAVWGTFYDVRRYGGLQMLLRALLGGGSMILSDANESPSDLLTRLGQCGVTHISGTPSHWRRALMSAAAAAMTPSYVRLSGEIADQAILDSLHRTYPNANLAHAYATTEAGVGFDVRDGKAGFPASLIGDSALKAELKVEGGTLHIRSARTASGYIGKSLSGANGFIDTGDMVEKRGDRYYFVGRKEGVINVGGQKVYPEEVEAVITQHSAIQMARVWGRKSPITGSLVAVDILLRDSTVTFAEIRNDVVELCRSHLAAWKVPVSLRQVTTIELNPAGKIARHA